MSTYSDKAALLTDPSWISLVVGLALMVIALVFFIKRIASEGQTGLHLPLGMKVEKASAAVVIFCIGALFFGGSIWLLDSSSKSLKKTPEPSLAPIAFGTISSIDMPPIPSIKVNEADLVEVLVKEYINWIPEFFQEARIYIDMGSDQGIQVGYYFATVLNRNSLNNLPQDKIANLKNDEAALIKAVIVYPDTTVGQLYNWSSEMALNKLGKEVQKLPADSTFTAEQLFKLSAPASEGQPVVPLPPTEMQAYFDIDDEEEQALSDNVTEEKKAHFKDLIRKSDSFLLRFPNGYFAADVLFKKVMLHIN